MKLTPSVLAHIVADLGDVTAGKVRNGGNTAGILLSGALPATWTTYMDLTATGANPVLHHPKFALNADGTATSNRSRCRVFNSVNQSISTGTPTALTFNSESFDVDGLHSTSSNTSRITIPTGGGNGVWVFIAHVKFAANGTGGRQAYIAKNGGAALGEVWVTPSATNAVTATLAFVESAPSAADYYEVVAFQTSGGALDIESNSGAGTFFAAYHLW